MSIIKFAFLPPNSKGAKLCTYLKSPLYWEQSNHTKNNQSNNTRKLGWVPYGQCQYIVFLQNKDWYGTN